MDAASPAPTSPLILSVLDKRIYLARIVRMRVGEAERIEPDLVNGTKYDSKDRVVIDVPDKLAAIKLDNTLAGHDGRKQPAGDAVSTKGLDDLLKRIRQ